VETSAIRGWIHQAGEIPSPDPGDEGKRLPLAALVQFESVADAQAAIKGAPVVLGWIWDRPKETA
jgi:hypothetical protein